MALATDSNPGHVSPHLAAARDEHGRDAVPHDGGRMPDRRDARRRAGARARRSTGTLETGKHCDLAIWNIERPAELVYHLGRNPLHARVWRGR